MSGTNETLIEIRIKEVLEFYGVQKTKLKDCAHAIQFAIIKAIDDENKEKRKETN